MIRHVIISTALFAFETVVGLGLLGMGIGFVMMIVALASAIGSSGQRGHHLGVAVIYAALCASTMGVILSNWRMAQHRATPVIAAPRAGFTLVGRRYGYIADRPQLYFPAMFHGIVAYDFPTHGWRTNE
ncbi:MAG: hypothetical protein DMG83_02175 [Acidobacteria bacterium]|nr:MAG: hypothetical protein DMG83_02175 [Acidobacteriota bacterium]